MAYPWLPDLSDVGSYVPTRTVPVDVPGNDDPLGTFTDATTPTDAQATTLVEDSADYVAARVGAVDPTLYGLAKAVTALRAAAFIELTYPTSEGTTVGEQLLEQANIALESLREANASLGVLIPGEGNTAVPVWSFPDPQPAYDTTLL